MDVGTVIASLSAGVPATIAAIAAYRKSAHTARRIGVVPRRERQRIEKSDNFKGHRSGDKDDVGDGLGLSVNTVLGIIHADVVDVREEVGELRDDLKQHIRSSEADRAELHQEIKEHILTPKPRRS